jgi:hypothetical protein
MISPLGHMPCLLTSQMKRTYHMRLIGIMI